MRSRLWLVFTVVLLAIPAWAAEPPAEPEANATSVLEQNARDFERDTALGAVLSVRPGTDAEIRQLQAVASSGLKVAEEAVAKYPDNAQAHYLVGSWLLYGYRVKEVRQVVVTRDTAASGSSTQVVQGLEDDVDRGLAALKKAADLDPDKARYVIDYGAALFDCGRVPEAMGYLKSAWATKPELAAAEKLEIALLLSRLYETQGRTDDAREWVYSGLAANPDSAAVVQHLRWLDKALPEAEELAAEEAEWLAELAAEAPREAEMGEKDRREARRPVQARRLPAPATLPDHAPEAISKRFQRQTLHRSREAPAGMLSQCPFDLRVGMGVRLVPSTGEEWIVYLDMDADVNTVKQVQVGRWAMTGRDGQVLRIGLPRSQVTSEYGQVTAVSVRTGSPEAEGFIWQDQAFEVYLDGALAGAFSNTAEYTAARSK